MKYLITGCAGFIGSSIALRLAALGEDVWGIDSLVDSYDIGLRKNGVSLFGENDVAFSMLDLASDNLAIVSESWDYVIHCAGLPGYLPHLDKAAYERCNVTATVRLLDALEMHGSPARIIYLSSSSVVGLSVSGDETLAPRPCSNYGISKWKAEKLIGAAQREGVVESCVLRLFSVYGERQRSDQLFPRVLGAMQWKEAFRLNEGAQSHVRDFVHIDDVCSAVLKVIGNWEASRGEIFHIGSGRETIVDSAIERACKVFGGRPSIDLVPGRKEDQFYAVANIRKASDLLGWVPRVDLDEGLRRLFEFSKGHWY
ncbi:NAD dependent epimerase/dehydratase family [Verrucomicrobiia bacterium DG1235]|nr:NAD dependent epimerase/dehydratase family [Verrucomicrobiae bacterium DG1235]